MLRLICTLRRVLIKLQALKWMQIYFAPYLYSSTNIDPFAKLLRYFTYSVA